MLGFAISPLDCRCSDPGTVRYFGSAPAQPDGSRDATALPSWRTAQHPHPKPADPGTGLNASGAGSGLLEEVPEYWQGQPGQPVPARRS